MLVSLIASMLMVGSLMASVEDSNISNDVSYIDTNATVQCIQVAEFSADEKWVKMTDRQLRSSIIYILADYTPLKMDFGKVKLRYTETVSDVETPFDVYSGFIDDGRKITVSSLVGNRLIMFVEIENLHLKRFDCISN